jgi:signal transduction histidine kinase
MTAPAPAEFAHIAAYLHERRDPILARWRVAVDNDPKVSAVASLARSQFLDHVPRILDAFERVLRARDVVDELVAATEQRAGAADHGESRWLHGYNSRETMREWGHLHVSMMEELESFALDHPDTAPITVSTARLLLTRFFVDCMVDSAASHVARDRTAAESRLEELERASRQLRALDSERTELWREAAHDLRGTVGAVKLATAALGSAAATTGPAPQLPEFVSRVRRSVESLEALLSELIELTRLEAGREHREVARFDAAGALVALCDSLQPMAAERQLFLRCEGPPELPVEGDSIKIRRIAQNLILNALNYTENGGVLVSCARLPGDVERWSLCVQDTGVGLERALATPLAQVIRAATKEASSVMQDADAQSAPAGTLASQSTDTRHAGEGIGLSIVKRLCELLDASIELETQRGRGTTFRIVFPSQYSSGPWSARARGTEGQLPM